MWLCRGIRLCLSSSTLIVLTLAVLATPAGAVLAGQLERARSYQTEKLIFAGNHQLADSDLTAVMETKARPFYQLWKKRPPFDPAIFAADLERLKRLYQIDGYYRAQLTYDLELIGDRVTARITITEGPKIKVASIKIFTAAGAPEPATLEPQLQLRLTAGGPFDQAAYQLSEQQLVNLYHRHGYAFATAERSAQVFVDRGDAYVWYTVTAGQRGVFGATTIAGAQKVDPAIIRRELDYKTGDPYNSTRLAASRQNLLKLNLFSMVQFAPQRDPVDPASFPIALQVREKPPRELNLMLGYNTETQLNASLTWNHYNFLGGGRQLTLIGTYSDVTSTLDAKLIQPYLLSRDTRGVLEVAQEQQTYQTYTLNASELRPRLQYITSRLTLELGWRLEYLQFSSLSALTINELGGVRRNGILSGPAGNAIYNTTDDPLDPQHGFILTFSGNEADHRFGSDYRYWRIEGEGRNYQRIGWRTVLASRLELGLGDTFGPERNTPLSERFYSGGEGSVRGYGLRRIGPISAANDPLGGLDLFEGSVELRRPLFWKLNGAVFFDCGQVSPDSYRIPVDNLQCGYGPALSFVTPVGPLRVDLGFPTQRPPGDSSWQIYFSIGQFY